MCHSLGYGLFRIDAVNARLGEDGQGRILKLEPSALEAVEPTKDI